MPPVSEVEVAVTPGGTGGLSRDDCLCPVCLEIFIEPVTLPCTHTFCKPCFLETVDKATLLCPMCRKRVSTWARHNGRKKTLVNDELWRRVQAAFPMQCQRRLSGQEEEEYEDASGPKPRVSQPGELRREYEDQVSKLTEEKRELEEAERKASEAYIQHLLTEEEEQQAEERRRHEERQLETDEKLARLLSLELNPSPATESQRKAQLSDITPAKKKPNPNAGDIEKYLTPVPRPISTPETSPSSSSGVNKMNSLHSDKKPQSIEEFPEPPMPKLDFYGQQESSRMQCAATASAEGATHKPAGPPHDSPTRGRGSGKRKSWEMEQISGGGEMVSKRSCPTLSPPRHREDTSGPETPVLLQELVQREKPVLLQELVQREKPVLLQELVQREEHLFGRRQQEEEDRKLALALQKQLDREQAVDRSKGSSDQYELRQKPRVEPAPQSRPDRRCSRSSSSSTSKQEKDSAERRLSGPAHRREGSSMLSVPTSSGTPSSTLHKSPKQATLTDMFSGLRS